MREERERLRLSQPAFAELGGAKKHSQINYESDRRAPDSDYLSAIAKHGVDVLYILTGRPTPGLGLAREVRRRFGAFIDLGDIAEHIERLTQAEEDAGAAREREDFDRWKRAMAAVNQGLAGGLPLSTAKRAELILAAYDLLEEDDASSRERVIRLVKTA